MPHSEPCPICGNVAGNTSHVAREMMFGLGDTFEYAECGGCGALRILDVPDDLSRFYPAGYYSLGAREARRPGRAERRLRELRSRLLVRPAGSLAVRVALGPRNEPYWAGWLRGLATPSSAILDFGCGSGKLLLELRRQGFHRVVGFDPFLGEDYDYGDGLVIRRVLPQDWEGRFDLVMAHHSFEHVADPEATLSGLRRLLQPGGRALLRTPVADSFAWRRYGTSWVQLDAPRHLFVHTRRSIGVLAERTSFRVVSTICDSRAFQFWASEQYERGIPLRDPRSFAESPGGSVFSAEEIAEFERRAKQLNEEDDGDQAVFVLEGA